MRLGLYIVLGVAFNSAVGSRGPQSFEGTSGRVIRPTERVERLEEVHT